MNNNILKALVFIGFLGIATGSFAAITDNGFYVGGDIGAANLTNKESHSTNPESHTLGSMGIIGGGFVGYDYGVNCQSRAALEAFVDATGLNTNLQHASSIYKMKQRYNIGVRVLTEYVFTPCTVGHFIVGYVNGRFRIQDNGVYGYVKSAYRRNGFQLGAGLTTTLTDQMFVRVDALYNSYSSHTSKGAALVGTNYPFQFYKNRFKQLAGELSLIYKFC